MINFHDEGDLQMLCVCFASAIFVILNPFKRLKKNEYYQDGIAITNVVIGGWAFAEPKIYWASPSFRDLIALIFVDLGLAYSVECVTIDFLGESMALAATLRFLNLALLMAAATGFLHLAVYFFWGRNSAVLRLSLFLVVILMVSWIVLLLAIFVGPPEIFFKTKLFVGAVVFLSIVAFFAGCMYRTVKAAKDRRLDVHHGVLLLCCNVLVFSSLFVLLPQSTTDTLSFELWYFFQVIEKLRAWCLLIMAFYASQLDWQRDI
jgi:hypothetical protein